MTNKDKVKDLVKLGRTKSFIKAEMKGTLSPNTVEDYIRDCVRELKAEGFKIELRDAPERVGGFSKLADGKPISRLCYTVGSRLSLYRNTTVQQNCDDFLAERPKFASVISLRRMEMGQHDFTLTELEQIAGFLNITVSKLTEEPTGHKP